MFPMQSASESTEASASAWPQFSVRMLLIVVAAFAAQFALWRSGLGCATFGLYLFGLLGLIFLVSLVTLLYLLCPWCGPVSPQVRDRLAAVGRSARFGHHLFMATFLLTAAALVALESVTQRRLEARLERQLGFTHRVETYDLAPRRGDLTPYAAVQSVALDGRFDRAGFQPDDIILYEDGSAHLFQMLDQRRGKSVELTVIRPLATQPLLENCPRLVLTVDVPP